MYMQFNSDYGQVYLKAKQFFLNSLISGHNKSGFFSCFRVIHLQSKQAYVVQIRWNAGRTCSLREASLSHWCDKGAPEDCRLVSLNTREINSSCLVRGFH